MCTVYVDKVVEVIKEIEVPREVIKEVIREVPVEVIKEKIVGKFSPSLMALRAEVGAARHF